MEAMADLVAAPKRLTTEEGEDVLDQRVRKEVNHVGHHACPPVAPCASVLPSSEVYTVGLQPSHRCIYLVAAVLASGRSQLVSGPPICTPHEAGLAK